MRNIKIDEKWDPIFLRFTDRDYKHPASEKPIFDYKRDFLCFLAMLGYYKGERLPLSKSFKSFDSRLLEDDVSKDIINMLALATFQDPNLLLKDKDPDEKIALMFEEYINAGFAVIDRWLIDKPEDTYGDQAIIFGLREEGLLGEKQEPQKPSRDIFNF